jgi:hypothetical protein
MYWTPCDNQLKLLISLSLFLYPSYIDQSQAVSHQVKSVLPEFPIKDTPQIPLQIQPIRKHETMINWSIPMATTTIEDEYFCFRVISSVLAQHRTEMPDIMVP